MRKILNSLKWKSYRQTDFNTPTHWVCKGQLCQSVILEVLPQLLSGTVVNHIFLKLFQLTHSCPKMMPWLSMRIIYALHERKYIFPISTLVMVGF
jgi:hypothetical protein